MPVHQVHLGKKCEANGQHIPLRPFFATPPFLLCQNPGPAMQGWRYTSFIADDFPVDIDTASSILHPTPPSVMCPWPVTSLTDSFPVLPADVYTTYTLGFTTAIMLWFILGALALQRGRR
jgi:hypothetical protein